MNFRCNDCRTVTWVPTTSAWPALRPSCGAMNWMAVSGEVPIVASGDYVPTEADALRAEIAALKQQMAELTKQLRAYELFTRANMEPTSAPPTRG